MSCLLGCNIYLSFHLFIYLAFLFFHNHIDLTQHMLCLNPLI